MSRRIAVISDALSKEFIFKTWHEYYGGLFGFSNLFLVTYTGLRQQFEEFKLGGLIELPVAYDDDTRQTFISRMINTLLTSYDMIIRVDVDEFLVVDPQLELSLDSYLYDFSGPYLAARGFDVVQLPEEPYLPALPDGRILANRSVAYPNTALNKVCVMQVPVHWSGGFHFASVYPKFGPLFMLHMKRLDIGWQLHWYRQMFKNIEHNPNAPQSLKDYYSPAEQAVLTYHADISRRPRLTGIESWYRDELMKAYFDTISFQKWSNLYGGNFGHENVIVEIPKEWRELL